MYHHVVEVTPTLDTSAYGSGDHLGTLMTLTGALPSQGGGARLEKITIVDKAKQSAAINVLLFTASPTLTSVDNAALDISDSEMGDKCIGKIAVAAADYVALNANSVAAVCPGTNGFPVKGAAGSTTLYAMLQSAGTPTYAASSLVVKFHFTWD